MAQPAWIISEQATFPQESYGADDCRFVSQPPAILELMSDPLSLVLLGAAGQKFIGGVGQVVGPVLNEVGEEVRMAYVERRRQAAIDRTLRKMRKKLGDRVLEPGEVPLRVVKAALEDGSWCEAEIMSEYFAGILAASRSADGSNDRGASWAGLVARLSSLDVWLHYLLYDGFRRVWVGQDFNVGMSDRRKAMKTFFPYNDLSAVMSVHVGELDQSMNALLREDLLDTTEYWAGPTDFVQRHVPGAEEGGMAVCPSVAGVELFLWAHGLSSVGVGAFLIEAIPFELEQDFGHATQARSVGDIRREHAEQVQRDAQQAVGPDEVS